MSKSGGSRSRLSTWYGSAIRAKQEARHDPFAPAVVDEFLARGIETKSRSLAVESLLLPPSGEGPELTSMEATEHADAATRRVFADAAATLQSLYPSASPVEVAAMANALAEAATGTSLENEIAVTSEILLRARIGLAAGARGVGDICEPDAALRTAISVMAEIVVGRSF